MGKSIKTLVWLGGLSAILIFPGNLFGQKPAEELAIYQDKYPDELVIFLEDKEHIYYELQDDTVIVTIKVYQSKMHLSDNTGMYVLDKYYTSSFMEIEDVEAYTLIPGKKKYERIDVTQFDETYDADDGIFYDDNREVSFAYPGVVQGAKTVLSYTMKLKNPRLINPYFFDSYLPIDQASLKVQYDQGIEVSTQYFNEEEGKIQLKEQQLDNGQQLMTFSARELPKIEFESNSPRYNYLASGVYCAIRSYQKKSGETVKVIDGPEDLHRWYRSFVNNLEEQNEDVKSLVNSIINADDSELEKVRKIYYWVQSNIKYIAFEDGMRGFIPHKGAYVLDKRYGDCKDMASIIVSMLGAADIKANYTWIGSRNLPYAYSQTSSPITDDHMIATYTNNDKTYFLDATGSYTPLGFPTSMIQGKECLISKDKESFEIQTVPVIDKQLNVMSDTTYIELSDGNILGNGGVTFTGYAKVFNKYKLVKSNSQSVDKYVERLLSKGSNKFEISSYDISNVDQMDLPLEINYDFKIPDYYREIGNNIYINLVLDKTMTDALIENRTVPLENDYRYINNNVTRLQLPEGFDIKRLPDNLNESNEHFGFSITYTKLDNELIVAKQFYVDYLLLYPESFDDWNQIIDNYADATRQAIILTKKES